MIAGAPGPRPRPTTASPAASAAVVNGPGPGSPRGSPGHRQHHPHALGRALPQHRQRPAQRGLAVRHRAAPVTRCGSSSPVTRATTSSYAASPASQADVQAASTPERTLTRQPYVLPRPPVTAPARPGEPDPAGTVRSLACAATSTAPTCWPATGGGRRPCPRCRPSRTWWSRRPAPASAARSWSCDKDAVTLEDRRGRRRVFPLAPAGFLLDGQPVTLARPAAAPAPAPAGPDRVRLGRGRRRPRPRSPGAAGSGSRACTTPRWSSGSGATTCGSRASWWSRWTASTTWPARVRGFRPGPRPPARRAGRPPGARLQGEPDRRRGHRPARAGHRPPVRRRLAGGEAGRARHPRPGRWCRAARTGRPASAGALGWGDPRDGWRRVLAAVDSYADLEVPLLSAVEELIDFVTTDGPAPGDRPA